MKPAAKVQHFLIFHKFFLEKFASVTKKRGLGLNTFLAFKAVLAVGTVWCRWSL